MNIRAATLFILIGLLIGVPMYALGQISDTFEVSQLITGLGDTTPPTTPTNLIATAVSTSQIDLVWTVSTDDVAVVGYQVFRDGMFVATSTTPNYSDTGLTASTTYDYNVTAFDAVFNISGMSVTVSTTTLSEPVEPPGGSGGSGRTRIVITSSDIVPEETFAVVTWRTNTPTRSRVLWGLTPDYELGTLGEVDARTEHTAKLNGLIPGVRYYIKIVALNQSDNAADTLTTSFVTLFAPDTIPPASLISFQAVPADVAIDLSWINPLDIDLEAIRIIRSDKFFPDTPFAGKLIFEGLGTNMTDTDVEEGVTYYYAAFARDVVGNYAAPAIASAKLGEEVVKDPFEALPDATDIPESIEKLMFLDFDFIQDRETISFLGTNIPVDGSKPLTVSIDYEKLPEVLKTIGLTLEDPEDENKTFSFLLRINDEKTQYTATLAPFGRSGIYNLVATVIDLRSQKLKTFNGKLIVPEMERVEETSFGWIIFWILLLFILLLIIILLLKRRRSEDEEEINVHI